MLLSLFSAAMLFGCVSYEERVESAVDISGAMEFLGPEVRPEILLFPDYLVTENFELNQHGRIPNTSLIGADMKTDLVLAAVNRHFGDQLAAKDWKIERMEAGQEFFRIKASRRGESIEIRAVQGSGLTHVFLLYQPNPQVESLIHKHNKFTINASL